MTQADRATLMQLPLRFSQGWNRKDAAATFADYADDAEFINVFGMRWQGKVRFVEEHAARFAGIFSQSTLTFRDVSVRAVGRDAAIVCAVWTMKGHQVVPGHWAPVRSGVLTFVAEKVDARWQIAASHNTDIVDSAP